METQSLINLALGATLAGLGWFANEMWSAVKELKSDLSQLREQLPTKYVDKTEYRSDTREIKEMLNKIFDRLDHKADKP